MQMAAGVINTGKSIGFQTRILEMLYERKSLKYECAKQNMV
jgi:hypothetical protein